MTHRSISNHQLNVIDKTTVYSNPSLPPCDCGSKKFFTIVLPTFNRARLLPRAIQSVLAQEDTSWELIVVDDGSSDNTAALVEEYRSRDARIRLVSCTHRGLAQSRAAGIAAACGEYITFIDSDDEYAPSHLHLRHNVLRAFPNIELVHGGVVVIGDAFVADKFNPTQMIPLSDCVIGGTFVIARRLLDRIPWPIEPYGDDNTFYHHAVSAGAMITSIDSPTYIYYRGETDSLCSIVAAGGLEAAVKFQGQ